ncbi:MAG: peptidylprolyl isomerase [Hyphomonadaceae bacterium]
MRALVSTLALLAAGCASAPPPATTRTIPEIMASATDADWRALDPENTLYMELPAGRVVIELAPAFAPNHVANVKALARQSYFDGAAIVRAQDNYVVQWSRAPEDPREIIAPAQAALPAEFARPIDATAPFTPLPDRDTYAPQIGFSEGFPIARDRREGLAWLAHCYAMVGAGRDVSIDSGGGAELYAVIGQSPRNLDRNVTLLGRIVQGVELLSALPRGTGDLGFYESAAERTPIRAIRVAADVPPAERTNLEIMRTESAVFQELIAARRNRRDEWYVHPQGAIGLCNVPIPIRTAGIS